MLFFKLNLQSKKQQCVVGIICLILSNKWIFIPEVNVAWVSFVKGNYKGLCAPFFGYHQ